MDYLKIISIFLFCVTLSSSLAIQHRYGGGGERFKRPFAPSFEGSQGYSYGQQQQAYPYAQPQSQQQSYPYSQPQSQQQAYPYAQAQSQPIQLNPVQPLYATRPFGLPEERPRFVRNNAFTYKLPDTDPPPPPVKHGYISKPYADYVVSFGSGSGGLTVINRPTAAKAPPPPVNPISTSFYANDNVNIEPSIPARQPEDAVNVYPPLTSVYVISGADDKKEGAKEAFVGLHKEPVFGSSPDNSVIRPLAPNQIVYSPNQKPSEEQGEEFKPMYIFGPVFYPKDSSGSGSSDTSTILKASVNVTTETAPTTLPPATTTTAAAATTEAPAGSSSDSAAEENKSVPADETISVSDESSSSSSSSSGGKGGKRGGIIRGIIKGLLGVDGSDDLDLTNSRADEDTDDEIEEHVESDNSTANAEDAAEEDYEPAAEVEEEEEIEKPKKPISSSSTRKTTSKRNRNKVTHRRVPPNTKTKTGGNRKDVEDVPASDVPDAPASVVPAIEEKKETNINGNVAQQPQQNLEVSHQDGGNSNDDDPDPIVGPLQIGFIGPQPGFPNQFAEAPMQPYFYPAGISMYNRPQINPFSPTGVGFSNDQFGFEADHTQPHHQQPQPSAAQFTPEMIKHEEEKIRQNFENQQQKTSQGFENTAEAVEATNSELHDKPEVSAHIEQGIAIDNKRETTASSVDHTDRYDDQTTTTAIVDGGNVDVSEKVTLEGDGQKEDTSTAYADIKSESPVSYYNDASPASQTSSILHVEPTFIDNDKANFNTGNDNGNFNNNDNGNFNNNDNGNFNNNDNGNFNSNDNAHYENQYNKDRFNGNYNENVHVNNNENVHEEQTSTASVSTRKPFPSYHQRYFRPKNRNYIAPTTYRPSYPRTPAASKLVSPVSGDFVEDNQLDDQKDSSATLYNSIQYEPLAEQSPAVTPVIHVEPYGDKQLDASNSETVETVARVPEATYGSRIQTNNK